MTVALFDVTVAWFRVTVALLFEVTEGVVTRERRPCIYILASKAFGTLYIGVTSDLIARLWQHRSGETKGFTSKYRVYRLIRFEMFETMLDAISREKQLKRWHRQWKINLIESENPA